MPNYRFRARNNRGDAIQGQMEATSADAVASQLINSGITPIEIVEQKVKEDPLSGILQKLRAEKPDLDDLILLCRQLYTLTKAGVPIIRGITGLAETTRNQMLSDILKRIRADLESGRELSVAMAQYPDIFSTLMVSMVKVGENTGQLEEVFLQLSRYLELDRETRARVKAALRYPTFVIIAIAIAIAIVNIFVIPAFANVFSNMHMDLPWQTRLLVATSAFFVATWKYMLLGLVVAVVAARNYVKTPAGRYRWDTLKLRIPIAGDIILRATLGRFARSFSLMVASGMPLIPALTIVARAVDNEYIGERITSMRTGIERGDSLLRTASATAMFTPLVLQMMAVGEETGSVDQMMAEVADFYEREVDYDIKNLSSYIEPILIVAVGILVLILALGIFLPMWNMTELARHH